MKLLISLLLLLHCAVSVPAQTPVFDWAKSWKAASNALGILSMQVDDKGAAYFTGIFKGTRDFDPGPGVFKLTATPGTFLEDSFDVFIVKLDALGHFVWAKSLSGPYNDMAFSLALDRDRNVYTVGTFCATVDFDPGAGTFPLVAADTQSLYISKLDQDGNFVWAQTIGKRNLARLVNISKDSFLYVSGNAPDTTDIDPGPGVHMLNGAGPYVLKLDLDGHFIRAAKLGSGKNFLICATVDRTGNFYTGGRLSGSSDFDPDHGGYIVASNNAYLTKYDDTGKLLWIRELEGKTSLSGSWVTAVSSDSAQNLYASGSFFGTIDFDPGPDSVKISAGVDGNVFIMKLNRDGKLIWAKTAGGSENAFRMSMTTDARGNAYVAGEFKGTGDFDPDPDVSYNLKSYGETDIFLLQLDPEGQFVWAKNVGGPLSDYENNIALGMDGSIYNSGAFAKEIYFDESGDPATILYDPEKNGALLIHKMKLVPAGTDQTVYESGFRFYPNPSTGKCYIDFGSTPYRGHQIVLMNMMGQIILRDNDIHSNCVDLSPFAPGMYRLLILKDGSVVFSGNLARI